METSIINNINSILRNNKLSVILNSIIISIIIIIFAVFKYFNYENKDNLMIDIGEYNKNNLRNLFDNFNTNKEKKDYYFNEAKLSDVDKLTFIPDNNQSNEPKSEEYEISLNEKEINLTDIKDEEDLITKIIMSNEFNITKIRELLKYYPIIIADKEEIKKKKEKEVLMAQLSKSNFKGKWKANNEFILGNANEGKVNLKFRKAQQTVTKEESLLITLEIFENDYIDHRMRAFFHSTLKKLNISIDEKNKKYDIQGIFYTEYKFFEVFSTVEESYRNGLSNIKLSFPLSSIQVGPNVSQTHFSLGSVFAPGLENLSAIVNSDLGFKFILEAQKENKANLIENEIHKYTWIVGIEGIIYCIIMFIVCRQIKNNDSYGNAISLYTFIQNIIWHSYGCITHLNLSLLFFDGTGNLLLCSSFSCLCLTFDFKLLYHLFEIRNRTMNSINFVKLKLKVYAIFYIFFFVSFFLVSYFYFDIFYVFLISLFLWSTQIFYIAKEDISVGLPFLYIFMCTLDRIFNTIYFRGFNSNFFNLKPDYFSLSMILSFILLTIIIMYIQLFAGPRFFLPKKCHKKKYNFYKSKIELINFRPNIGDEECVICLYPIFSEDIESEQEGGMIELQNINISEVINNYIENQEQSENSYEENNISKENVNDDNEKKNNINNSKTNISSISTNTEESNGSFILNDILKKSNNNEFISSKDKENNKDNESLNDIMDINDKTLKKKNDYELKVGIVSNNIKKNKNKFVYISNIFKKLKDILKIIIKENFYKFYKNQNDKNQKPYMITPCSHVFHTECLESWLNMKKECPNCREDFSNIY